MFISSDVCPIYCHVTVLMTSVVASGRKGVHRHKILVMEIICGTANQKAGLEEEITSYC